MSNKILIKMEVLNRRAEHQEMQLIVLVPKTRMLKDMNKQQKMKNGNKTIKQRITEGSILEIKIEGQYYVYAQILAKGRGYAFFDFKSEEKINDLTILLKSKVLFIVALYNYIVTKGIWVKIGRLPIREDLQVLPMKFIQDRQNPSHFQLYNPNTGVITQATREECEGLECAAVWAENHVEERIRDYYLGVPNIWLENLKIK